MSVQADGAGSGSAESWTQAKKHAAALGSIPSSFSVVVRALINDHVTFHKKLRPVNKFQVARLLRGPSFKVMLYFATKSLRPSALEGKGAWNLGSMMAAFTPLDLASLIASFVYFRKCKKLVPDHFWGPFALSLQKDPQYGAAIGSVIDEIGTGSGLVAGTFQHFARCCFAAKNSEAFAEYASKVGKVPLKDLCAEEHVRFGCSAPQIAVMLLSTAGFGADLGNGYAIAFDDSRPSGTLTDSWALAMRYARIWIDDANAGFDQPREKIPARFFPNEEGHQWLKQTFVFMREGQVGWLQRSKSDLNAKTTPELFTSAKGLEDIPDALRDVFSIDEITAMEEDDFDDLIDQIDEEQASGKRPEVLDGKDLSALEDIVA